MIVLTKNIIDILEYSTTYIVSQTIYNFLHTYCSGLCAFRVENGIYYIQIWMNINYIKSILTKICN